MASAIPDEATVARTGPDSLRIAVRPASFIDNVRRSTGAAPVHAALAGPLVQVAMLDFPNAAMPVAAGRLATLGLTEGEALARARANTVAALRPMAEVARPLPLPPNSIGTIDGDYYESSRLVDHAGWAEIARGAVGRLLVLAPDATVVLYTDDGQPMARDALLTLGGRIARQGPRPLPLTVFAWTPGGWEVT